MKKKCCQKKFLYEISVYKKLWRLHGYERERKTKSVGRDSKIGWNEISIGNKTHEELNHKDVKWNMNGYKRNERKTIKIIFYNKGHIKMKNT